MRNKKVTYEKQCRDEMDKMFGWDTNEHWQAQFTKYKSHITITIGFDLPPESFNGDDIRILGNMVGEYLNEKGRAAGRSGASSQIGIQFSESL